MQYETNELTLRLKTRVKRFPKQNLSFLGFGDGLKENLLLLLESDDQRSPELASVEVLLLIINQ